MYVTARLRARREKKGDAVRSFMIEVHDPARRPERKRISLSTADKSVAARRFSDLEARLRDGSWDPWRQAVPDEHETLRETVDRFVVSREAEGLAKGSVDTYATVLGSLAAFLAPGFPLGALTDDDVTRWLETPSSPGPGKPAKPRADATKASYRQRVRIFAAWAVEEGGLRSNPVSTPKARGKRSRQKALPKALTAADERRLLATIESDGLLKPSVVDGGWWLLSVVRFALGTGLRRGELVALRWGDVDLAERIVRVAIREGWSPKSGRERTVPLVGDALAVVRRLARERTTEDAEAPVFEGVGGEALSADYLSKRFTHYRKLAGLPDQVSFHSLRHTYASRLVRGGASVYKVQALLGHASVRTTQQYAHLTGSDVRGDVERVLGDGEPNEAAELARENARLKEENERLTEEAKRLEEELRALRAELEAVAP